MWGAVNAVVSSHMVPTQRPILCFCVYVSVRLCVLDWRGVGVQCQSQLS